MSFVGAAEAEKRIRRPETITPHARCAGKQDFTWVIIVDLGAKNKGPRKVVTQKFIVLN